MVLKRIILLSHCVLNSFCELPQAPDNLREEILKVITDKHLSIVQLPCPELSYQGLSRSSIYPGTPEAEEYENYCKQLLSTVVSNIKEYKDNDIEIAGIIGIDTSPSCSIMDSKAIMMKVLMKELSDAGITIKVLADMPVEGDGESFLENIKEL